jgi:hypothetical protein
MIAPDVVLKPGQRITAIRQDAEVVEPNEVNEPDRDPDGEGGGADGG